MQKASEVLHVTPASVSIQVRQLEKAFGVKLENMDDEWKFGQERAYTSPIWYTP